MGCKSSYEGCSEVLVDDYEISTNIVVKDCECPSCHRLLCVNCEVPLRHHGFDCEEFESVTKNTKEEKSKVLARQTNWKKCSNCTVHVEKIDGCIHITCRCNFVMCYAYLNGMMKATGILARGS